MNQAVKELYDQYCELVMLNNKTNPNNEEELETIKAKFDSFFTKILTDFRHTPSKNEVKDWADERAKLCLTLEETPLSSELFENIPENMLWYQASLLLLGCHKLPGNVRSKAWFEFTKCYIY